MKRLFRMKHPILEEYIYSWELDWLRWFQTTTFWFLLYEDKTLEYYAQCKPRDFLIDIDIITNN